MSSPELSPSTSPQGKSVLSNPSDTPPAELVPSVPQSWDKIPGWFWPTTVGLISFLAFLQTVGFDFVMWDDDIEIYSNQHLTGVSFKSLAWAFTDVEYVRRYIPLSWTSWLVNFDISRRLTGSGLTPWTYHAGNVLIHSANAVLVYFVLGRVLQPAVRWARVTRPVMLPLLSAFGAVAWATHPLRVEVVAWANSRIHNQTMLFVLLSLLAYLRSHDAGRSRGAAIRWYCASVAAYFGSLLCYGTALGFVAVLLVLDLLLLRRADDAQGRLCLGPGLRRSVLDKIPFALAAGTYLCITLRAAYNAKGIWEPPVPLNVFGPIDRLSQACYMLLLYLWKPFAPLLLTPMPEDLLMVKWTNPAFLLSMFGVALLTAVAIALRKRSRWVLGLWICHGALLAPMLGWTEHPHFPCDRYSYGQGVLYTAVLITVILGLWRLRPTRFSARVLAIGGAILISAWTVQTIAQNGAWRDSETLFRQILAGLKSPNYRAEILFRLGTYYQSKGRMVESIEVFDQAVTICPEANMVWFRRGLSYLTLARSAEKQANGDPPSRRGHAQRARQAFAEAARSFDKGPKDVATLEKAGVAHFKSGELDQASECFEFALKAVPGNPVIMMYLAQVRGLQGRHDEATQLINSAVAINPQLARDGQAIIRSWPTTVPTTQHSTQTSDPLVPQGR